MNCKKCGNMLAPTDTFCKNCGEPVTPTVLTQAENNNNNNTVVNPPGESMTFMTPPSEPGMNQNQQPVGEQSVTPPTSNITTQEPVQPVLPEQNNNLVEQPVSPAHTETVTTINQPAMTLNQSLNSQMGEAQINESSTVTPQQPTIQPMPNMAQSDNLAQTQPVGSTTETEPTEKVKKKSSPVLIIILAIVLIGVVGFEVIYFVKPFDKKNNNADTTNNDNQETLVIEAESIYANWMNYILNQNISEITLERFQLEGEKEKVQLNNDDLNNVFSKLVNNQLIKRYYEGTGMADGDILTITYTKDDNNYEVKIANGIIWADSNSLKDEDLLNALESSEHTIENEELKDKEDTFYNYILDNYDSTILDEYFITEKIEENQ